MGNTKLDLVTKGLYLCGIINLPQDAKSDCTHLTVSLVIFGGGCVWTASMTTIFLSPLINIVLIIVFNQYINAIISV